MLEVKADFECFLHLRERKEKKIQINAIILIFLVYFISCQYKNNNEEVNDYFYQHQKGKTYVYDITLNENIIKKYISIDEVITDKNKTILFATEILSIPPSLSKEMEISKNIDSKIEICEKYRYILQNNIIKKKKILADNSAREEIYLKGPIKIGTKWKIRALIYNLARTKAREIEDVALRRNRQLKRSDHVTYREVNMTIIDRKEENILGEKRICIIISIDDPYYKKIKEKPKMELIFAKGLGYIGMYIGNDECEKLVEVMDNVRSIK